MKIEKNGLIINKRNKIIVTIVLVKKWWVKLENETHNNIPIEHIRST